MTTLATVGSGHIGSTVARLAVAAGYDVVLSNSRGPQTLADLVAELGPRASAATTVEAVAAGDLVLVSIPTRAVPSLPAEPFAGKVVMDTNNFYAGRDGEIPGVADGTLTVNEYLARHLPAASVVKVFNNIFFKLLGSLARPAGAPDRSALAIAGDDAGAKAAVTRFLDDIGYDAVDAGPLAEGGRLFQVDTPAYGLPYGGMTDTGTPANAAAIRDALAAAGPTT
jgi:8-hydroxy-5-deazaflavin:NADPH oxidoreductase